MTCKHFLYRARPDGKCRRIGFRPWNLEEGEEERPCLIMGIIQANGSVESRVRQIRSPASNVNGNVTFLELSITFFFTHPLGFLPFPLGPSILFPCFINGRYVLTRGRCFDARTDTLIPNGYSRNAQSPGEILSSIFLRHSPPP